MIIRIWKRFGLVIYSCASISNGILFSMIFAMRQLPIFYFFFSCELAETHRNDSPTDLRRHYFLNTQLISSFNFKQRYFVHLSTSENSFVIGSMISDDLFRETYFGFKAMIDDDCSSLSHGECVQILTDLFLVWWLVVISSNLYSNPSFNARTIPHVFPKFSYSINPSHPWIILCQLLIQLMALLNQWRDKKTSSFTPQVAQWHSSKDVRFFLLIWSIHYSFYLNK